MQILSPQLQKLTPLETFEFVINFVDFLNFTDLMDFYNCKMMDS